VLGAIKESPFWGEGLSLVIRPRILVFWFTQNWKEKNRGHMTVAMHICMEKKNFCQINEIPFHQSGAKI
jgi:hypothetical protein